MEFASVGFCEERKTRDPVENPSSKDENRQQTRPTYDADSGETIPGHNCGRQALLLLRQSFFTNLWSVLPPLISFSRFFTFAWLNQFLKEVALFPIYPSNLFHHFGYSLGTTNYEFTNTQIEKCIQKQL